MFEAESINLSGDAADADAGADDDTLTRYSVPGAPEELI